MTNMTKERNDVLKISLFIVSTLVLLVVGLYISVMVGAKDISFNEIILSLSGKNPDTITNNVIWEIRFPRPIAAIFVGAFLSVACAMIQGITRNPLGDSSILGINQGASFVMALALSSKVILSSTQIMIFSLLGASISGMFVYFISSRSIKGVDPIKLTLGGTAIGTLLISLATLVAIKFNMMQRLSFWIAGSLSTSNWSEIKLLIIVGIVFITLAIIISPYITILSLGEEVAIGLGQNTSRIKLYSVIIIIALTGSAVSVAGNVALLGLIVPQIIRGLFGTDYKRVIPLSALLGAVVLIYSDILARVISPNFEVPLGSITALIGVPFFVYLLRKRDVI